MFCNGQRCSWKFRKIHTPLPESRFLLKLLTEWLQLYWKDAPVQEISRKFCEISKSISFTENYWTTTSGNDPGESLVFWRKSLRNASFLTIGRLYFNSMSLQKVPQKVIAHTIQLLIGGISHISKIMPCRTWRRWNKCFQNFSYSIHTECLTVYFIVSWQENIKMKILNFTLASNLLFIFYIAAISRSSSSLVFCSKAVLRLALVYSKCTGNREIVAIRIRRWLNSRF